jgi:hypothetical protein
VSTHSTTQATAEHHINNAGSFQSFYGVAH